MPSQERINILLVDDQPAKLLSLRAILEPLRENVLSAASADEALKHLLQNEIAVVLVDVCMPGMDGFELAAMIRDHPRHQRTAIIFISAVHLTDDDRLRGYRLGAVDYIPVPIVPDVLRAKVAVFAELHRKTEQLNSINRKLEQRVAERTAELQHSNALLLESRSQIAHELAATQQLHAISTRLTAHDGDDLLYEHILDAAVAIMRSDLASIQLFHPDRGQGELELLSHRGLTPDAAAALSWIPLSAGSPCGAAARAGRRIILADVGAQDDLCDASHRECLRGCGIQSCQSTPLISRDARLLGMISTHWRRACTPAERELRLLDVLARQAADLIERSQTERARRQSEAQFRLLADNMAQLAWIADSQGQVTWCNQRWYDFTGLSLEESRGSGWTRTLHPEHAERIIAKVRRCFADGQSWEDTFLTRGRDGSFRWFLTRAFPVTDPVEQATRWFGTGTDVTEQREAEAVLARDRQTLERLVHERTTELNLSNDRLRVSERMATIGSLSAGLGHDIGNLLLPVRMRLDSLDRCHLPDAAREDVAAIRKAAEYLQNLSGNLRLLSLDASRETAVATDIPAWWAEAEGLMRSGVGRAIAVAADIPPDLPPVRIGKASLTQVVFNLVQNAGDALAPRGEGLIAISAKADSPGWITLSVTDNGPGMSDETCRRCTEPFFTTKSRSLGTGLGLPLVSAIIKRAGGTLQVRSAPGQGTNFSFLLPVASPPRSPSQEPTDARRTASVLLGDARVAAHTKSALESLGFVVDLNADPDADLWVADDHTNPDALRAFALRRPARSILLFGHRHAFIADHPGVHRLDPDLRLSEIRPRVLEWAGAGRAREPVMEPT